MQHGVGARRRGFVRAHVNRRPQVAVVGQALLDGPGDVGRAVAGRRGAESLLDRRAQRVLRQAQVAGEGHAPDFGKRHQVDVHADAVALREGRHLDVDVAAHAHEVHDRLAHGVHGEGLPRPDLDEAFQLGVLHGLAAGAKPRLPHLPPEQLIGHLPADVGRTPP